MKKWYKIPNPDCHIRCILTRLLLQFEPYFEPKWPNSAKMKKAKLAFWPTFSFLLRSLLLLFFYGGEQWTSRHDLAYFCFFSRMQPNKGEALADLGAAEELLHWRSLRDDCSLENIRFMTSL